MAGDPADKAVVWEKPTAAEADIFGMPEEDEPAPVILQGPHQSFDFARKLYTFESLQPAPQKPRAEAPPEPYSLQWFLDIENQRHSKHGQWIPKLLEFAKHRGETLLGLGHGLGTDWVQYAQHGASVVVCSPKLSQLELVRRNFEVRGLPGRYVQSQPWSLPLDSNSIDVACISSLYHGIAEPEAVIEEVYRVLKPGGKVLAVTPARFDVDHWRKLVFFWHRWLRRDTQKPPRPSRRYSAWQLKGLFQRFEMNWIRKRQLRRAEVPRVWRWVPLPILARMMGHVLVLKAFKPLSAALQAAVENRPPTTNASRAA